MNLLKALATVGSMTFVSRILGFVRDSLIAKIFGAGMETDAFFVAFKIPNLLRRISAEGAFSQAFVPILAEYKNKRSYEATHLLINHVCSLLSLFLIAITCIGIFAAPWLVYISAPGFIEHSEKFQLTVDLLRITFPYIFFISLVSMASGILNTFNKFSVPALTPVWLNLSFIFAALFFADYFDRPILVLAWAVFVGGVLQLIFQIPFLREIGFIPKYQLDLKDEGVWRIIKLMGPAIFGVSIAQLSLLINTIFASFLETGSISWLYYADRLMEFPAGVLGVALGTILLPSLSKSFSGKDQKEYSGLLDWGLRLTFILAAPAAVALAVLSLPLIATLFHYGAFNMHDVLMTQQATIAYSFGLMGLIMIKVLAPGFYARQNIKTPVKIALFTLFSTQLMNMIFIGQFKHAGLALAIGLGACLNASLLYYHLRKGNYYKPHAGWGQFLIKLFVALVLMGLTLFYLKGDSSLWLEYSISKRLMYLVMLILAGFVAYFGSLWMMGLRLKSFIRRAV